MSASHTITQSPEISQPVLDAFFVRLERAVAAAYPFCGNCGRQLFRGELVDTTGSVHVHCPEEEPELEMLRRMR